MTENIFNNWSFEDGWTDEGNWQVPKAWGADATPDEYTVTAPPTLDDDGNPIPVSEIDCYTSLPELRVIRCEHLPGTEADLFCVEGDYCLKIFGGQRAIHTWLFQTVETTPGTRYRITVPVFVDVFIWDNGKHAPNLHYDEPEKRAGRIRMYALGEDGFDVQSQWFDEMAVNHWYLNQHELVWEFRAQRFETEVGLEFWCPWPIDNNGFFLDGLCMEKVMEEELECVPPRDQYSRTYILIPQQYRSEPEWAGAAAVATARDGRTVGYSADDAGVGPRDRSVVAVNPGKWGSGNALEDFFEEHYTGIKYSAVHATTPYDMAIQILPDLTDDIAQGQSWDTWKDEYFGENPVSTIGKYGCFLTGLSIMLRKVYGRDVSPVILDELLVMARVAYASGNLLMWPETTNLFDKLTGAIKDNVARTASEYADLLDQGYEVILRRNDGAHFVYLEKVVGNTLHIIDTLDGRRKERKANHYLGVRAAQVLMSD